jgi:large subunit ribosomal protein L25
MTTVESLRVKSRQDIGRGAARSLRRSGFVPGVIYGAGKENTHLAVDSRDISKALHNPGFFTHIYELKIDGATERALPRDVQFHPLTDQPIHVDFLRIGKDSKVNVAVPVTFINEEKSPGLKRGGVLNIVIHNFELICPADHIPDHLTVDLSGLEIGSSIHIEALNLPQGIVPVNPERDNTIATIVAPTVQKAEEEAEAAAAAAASTAAAAPATEGATKTDKS